MSILNIYQGFTVVRGLRGRDVENYVILRIRILCPAKLAKDLAVRGRGVGYGMAWRSLSRDEGCIKHGREDCNTFTPRRQAVQKPRVFCTCGCSWSRLFFFFTGSSLYKGGSGSDSTTLLDAVIPLLVYYSIYYLPVYSIGIYYLPVYSTVFTMYNIYYLPVYSIYYVLVYNIYSTCEDNEWSDNVGPVYTVYIQYTY